MVALEANRCVIVQIVGQRLVQFLLRQGESAWRFDVQLQDRRVQLFLVVFQSVQRRVTVAGFARDSQRSGGCGPGTCGSHSGHGDQGLQVAAGVVTFVQRQIDQLLEAQILQRPWIKGMSEVHAMHEIDPDHRAGVRQVVRDVAHLKFRSELRQTDPSQQVFLDRRRGSVRILQML